LHTIKGGAGIAGLDGLSRYTHSVENMLDEVRQGNLTLSGGLISLLLTAQDCLKGFMTEMLGEGEQDPNKVADSHAQILAVLNGGIPVEASPHPAPDPPLTASPAPASLHPQNAPNTFLIQVFVQPDFMPLRCELADVRARMQDLGALS
jgi:two-component system chemotaxis sensor kinase CheA